MYLVFSNCAKYNGPENVVTEYAMNIKNIFEDNLKQTGFMKWVIKFISIIIP